MKINFLSDLHLEFGDDVPSPEGDVLILAGDITTRVKQKHIDWINSLKFEHILYVMGNHEFYRGSVEKVIAETKSLVAKNVHVLENETVKIDGVNFHGATLWTDFDKANPISMELAEGGMNDYRAIRKENYAYRWRPVDALNAHRASVAYLKMNVRKGDVVVTHMAPSFQSIHPDFRTSRLNGCYASDLEDFMLDRQPELWFHGHVHRAMDYFVGDTRVLCNPRGYEGHEFVKGFDWNRQVEIDD